MDRFQVDLSELHSDTTRVYFEGAYEDENGHPLGGGERVPLLVEGYNKDGQRHKVQLVLSVITSGRTPVWYRPWDGNQTDEAVYVADLSELRRRLLVPDKAVLIGDRKLNTQETQAQLAAGKRRWQTVDYVSQNEACKSPAERAVHQVCEIRRDLPDPETGELYPLRWIFSHSSAKAAQDVRQRDKALAAGEHALRRLAGLLGKYDYTRRATIEARLEQALRKTRPGRISATPSAAAMRPVTFSCAGDGARVLSAPPKSLMGSPCCAPTSRRRPGPPRP